MFNRHCLLTASCICTLLLTGRMVWAQVEDPVELARKAAQADFDGVKTQPIKAAWEFSSDGGKTFAAAMPATFPANTGQVLVARATFQIDDPAAVDCLWAVYDEPEAGKARRGAFAFATRAEVGGVECGATPLWVNLAVALNGKTPSGPLPGMMYHALPLETAPLLVKGANTLTISGPLSALSPATQVTLKPLQLLTAGPGPARIRSGPVLGYVGEDFFTVACRTSIAAEVTVTAAPVEPAGAATTAASPVGFYHRLQVPLPKGTRRFSYTVASKRGDARSRKGPFKASLPAADAKTLNIVTFGNSRGNIYSRSRAPLYLEGMLKCKPDLYVHLGQVMEFPSWDFYWDTYYLETYAPLLATVPTYLAPDGGDHAGLALKLFSTPAGDSEILNWTQVLGGVRLIGIDGAYDWSAGSAHAKWLESVLKDSKERFILAFDHFPGYSSGQQSRPARNGKMRPPLQQCRDVICPMLGKYQATAIASAYDYDYERTEPTPDKGVTCIVAGAGGAKTYRQSNRASGNNPFAKTSVYREHTPSYVCFEIKADACVMNAYDLQGNVIDEKTFAPRQP